MTNFPDSPLTPDGIRALLPADFPWRDTIQVFDSIDSTNTRAKLLAENGAPEGTILIADTQTGGRGRRGRSFHSPAGTGIYFSLILRPDCLPGELMHLTCAVAVAMCNAVETATGLRPGIKWINDLVFGKRKLAGILTELGFQSGTGRVAYAVIGVGINCCQSTEDFPPDIRDMAGSLYTATGNLVSRERVAAAMLLELQKMNGTLLTGRDAMMEHYRKDCVTLGKEISLVRGDQIRHGTALTVDPQGALVVLFPDGHTEAVNSGEVSVRGMYGYV